MIALEVKHIFIKDSQQQNWEIMEWIRSGCIQHSRSLYPSQKAEFDLNPWALSAYVTFFKSPLPVHSVHKIQKCGIVPLWRLESKKKASFALGCSLLALYQRKLFININAYLIGCRACFPCASSPQSQNRNAATSFESGNNPFFQLLFFFFNTNTST